MRNGEPIHFCSGGWKHRDDDCGCPCSFCRIYSQPPECDIPGCDHRRSNRGYDMTHIDGSQ